MKIVKTSIVEVNLSCELSSEEGFLQMERINDGAINHCCKLSRLEAKEGLGRSINLF